ncbi:hypothetical protein [Bacillus pumilus]|uniref:hypothetical protein n=1 Tax=Bacillus pumilus TaxID=1408 RepID=UPI00119E988C|nr:hypothetical protein [Bacillus pumilus]
MKKIKSLLKLCLFFILGVVIVSEVYSVTNGFAFNGNGREESSRVVHGIIEANVGNETHIKIFDGKGEGSVVVAYEEGYELLEMVTVIYSEDKITSYKTGVKESQRLEKKYQSTIDSYRQKIIKSNLE